MPGISLGHNCAAATAAVGLGLRDVKANGYTTCPFDEMNSSYEGMLQCIKDDFAYFTDPFYLQLIARPHDCLYYPGETLLCNTKYGFIFNHESPGHADLYLTQAWRGGKTHYIDNSFERFRERYDRRIEHFRAYCRGGGVVTLLISTYPRSFDDLLEVLAARYPMTKFKVHRFDINNLDAWRYHMDLMGRISQSTSSSSEPRVCGSPRLADGVAYESSQAEAAGYVLGQAGNRANQTDQSVS
jgi:hypothetical protein